MPTEGNRRIGMIFGVLSAVLLALDGIVSILRGFLFLALGYGYRIVSAEFAQSVLFIVLGLVIGFLAFYGRSRGEDRSVVAGVSLLVLAIAGWLFLGLGAGLLGILSAIFALLAGIFFLVSGR
jgi:hypothetical protein